MSLKRLAFMKSVGGEPRFYSNTPGKLLTRSLKMCVHEFCQAEALLAQSLQITQDQTMSLVNLDKPFAVNFIFLNSDETEIQMYIITCYTVEVHLGKVLDKGNHAFP